MRLSEKRLYLADHLDALRMATAFWSLVEPEPRPGTGCRHWLGTFEGKGYGVFTWRAFTYRAHELALTLSSGEVKAPTLETCHSCDNPPCCSPSHLRFDSHANNMAEMVERERSASGAQSGTASLTEESVYEMRVRRHLGATPKDLAATYGTTATNICCITSGRTWQHVGGPLTIPNRARRASDDEIRKIKSLRSEGVFYRELALRFGYSISHIANICVGKITPSTQEISNGN